MEEVRQLIRFDLLQMISNDRQKQKISHSHQRLFFIHLMINAEPFGLSTVDRRLLFLFLCVRVCGDNSIIYISIWMWLL